MKKLPRITYGFLSSSVNPINISMPWRASDKDGMFAMNYNTADAIGDNLSNWAKTNKGERVMDVDFGLDARRYLFEPEIVLKDVIKNNARQQLKKYFPNLVVSKLEVSVADNTDGLPSNSVRFSLEVYPAGNEERKIKVDEVFTT